MIWIVLISLCLLLFYYRTVRTFSYWKLKKVPFRRPLPIFGNIMKVALGQQQVGTAIREIYDSFDENVPYFGMYILHKPFLVIRSKELAKKILIKDFNTFQNRPLYHNKEIDPMASNALFIMRGEEWKGLRNKLSPIYTSGKMKKMMPLITKIADQMELYVDTLTDGQEIDVRDLANRYSLDVICSCAFGINSNSLIQKDNEIKNTANKMLDLRSIKRSFAIGSYFFCPLMVELFKLTFLDKESSDYFVDIFKTSFEQRKNSKEKRNDLIDLMYKIKLSESEEDTFKFDDFKISAQALVFFTAGSETTVGTLSFCLYELAMNPYIQNTLRDEIRENMDSEGNISYEALFEMTYLDLVIKETLRKYPLTHLLMRYPETDYTFEETGLHLEKGTPVLLSMTSLHFDQRYFPDPDKFDPERFRGEKAKDLQYVYMPFGEGPRKCIGDRFALLSMKIAVFMFLKKFEITPCNKTEVPVKQSKTAFFIIPDSGSIFLNVRKIE
ncbi:cytochrome P450 6k1-like [Harmonia axyridis]|uniref:cytochrome P450 6k1-like n=1 Tax=Harmonia axyridis TaxID=115357 RepID=UPI001E2769AB|nr:cytochrome P450 6k1-like [Harmonia axyridis]XP_045473269.1 cytochrome P450 6k1-like [Harmonia axyridis]